MSAALDTVSQINYQRPYFGGHLDWVGKTEEAILASSKAVLNDFKAIVDPTNKTAQALEQNTVNIITEGVDKAFSAAGRAAVSLANATGYIVSPLTSTFSWLNSTFKWLVIGAVAVAAIYVLGTVKMALPSKS